MKSWYADTFAPLLGEIEQGLQRYIARQPRTAPLLWQMVDAHFGWDAPAGARGTGGKRVRPLLALLVARALTGRHEHVMPAALAIELIHNFTLIHDDVMDRSAERHHRATLWARWGTAQAVNSGDGLFALGMASVLDLVPQAAPAEKTVEAMRVVLAACISTVEGQMLDIGFETRVDVTPDEYVTMVANKSGALIESSATVGALLSTDDAAIVGAYARFARNLGIAFQMWDDYLGVWGEEAVTGKSATSDIEGKKKSYPVLVAFDRAEPTDQRRLLSIYQQDTLAPADVSTVVGILDAVDAKAGTKAMLDRYYEEALDALASIPVDNEDQRNLYELAAFLVERAY